MGCGWLGGWVAGWFHQNNATLWLHLASWALLDFQLCWESKMEPSVAKIHDFVKLYLLPETCYNDLAFLRRWIYFGYEVTIISFMKQTNERSKGRPETFYHVMMLSSVSEWTCAACYFWVVQWSSAIVVKFQLWVKVISGTIQCFVLEIEC